MMFNDKQIREIFHFLFLERLYRLSDINQYAIKGGVNLRFFYNSPRYSEDMDLDVFSGSVETLKKNGYKILNEASFIRVLRTFGIEEVLINDPNRAKHTATTQRFRVRLKTVQGDEYPTKVEFSRRSQQSDQVIKSKVYPEVVRAYKRTNFLCTHYTVDAAILQKFNALSSRTEPQTRDPFDLYLLLNSHDHTFESTKLDENLKKEATENLLNLSWEDYQGQVVEFLEEDSKKQYGTKEFWNEVQNNILDWLNNGQ